MATPSEIVYWEVLPAIRNAIVHELIKQGHKQIEVAKLLDITPSAVSQYLKNKRGSEIEFDSHFKKLISQSAKKIVSNESNSFRETNILIKEFDKSKNLCRVCCEKNNIEDGCNICH